VQGALLAAALLIVSAMPVTAQTLGAGISFLGDEGGTGFIVDYSKPLQSSTDGALGWVVDFSYNRKSVGGALAGGTATGTTMLAQGGVRMVGEAGENLTWHGQGLVGLRRSSVSFDAAGVNEEICDLLGINCSAGASDTGGVLTVGGALQYALNEGMGVRGQLDFPIAIGGDGGSTTRFSIMVVFAR
jgi:hypothetical protein